ncbi:MAG: hypothetical protein HKM06_04485, partial [Spirochaetales bacterium]|nr:hypothetical protein [Spirochaetales bacterium]
MKKIFFWSSLALVLGILFFLILTNTVSTPNTDPKLLSASVQVPSRLSELTPWLIQKESQFLSLKPWAAKKILWADPAHKSKTKISLVYLHGYSATRKEISPSVEDLAAQIGANVFFTRYT